MIFNELWTQYLPHIGGEGALLYCFLKSRVGQEIPNPCSKDWSEEVCQPLGVSVLQSHQAWARLQEMGLIHYDTGVYIMRDPTPLESPVAATAQEEQGQTLYAQVESQFGRPLSGAEIYQLETLETDYPLELIVTASSLAVQSQAFSLPYIKQVLLNWKAKGIVSAEQAEEDRKQYGLRKAKRHARRGDAKSKPAESRSAEPRQTDGVNYDDEELILKRLFRAAKGDVKHG